MCDLRRGRERAEVDFEQYVEQRGRALERYAYVLTGDAPRAQDLTQTALLKAYRRRSWVVSADHPDVYVRRIVTTCYLDWRRRRSSTEEPDDDAIARVLQCLIGAVRSHASRGLHQLRELMDDTLTSEGTTRDE